MTDHGFDELAPPGASVSALAVTGDGRVLATRTPDRAVLPASNTKLVTAAVALSALGPEFRFETTVVADGDLSDDLSASDSGGTTTLDGDLRLVGTGAPDLGVEAIETLADQVSSRVRAVTGDIIVDTSLFEGGRYGPGRTWRDARYAYGAPTAPVVVSGNVVTVAVEATGDGTVSVTSDPESDAISTNSEVRVVDSATPDDVDVFTDIVAGEIRVTGVIPNGTRVTHDVPVPDPAHHAGSLLRDALEDRDVAVAGTVVEFDGSSPRPGRSKTGDADTEPPLASVESAPLSTLVRSMNVPSDNAVADTLARSVAAEATGNGSWEGWADLVDGRFTELGVDAVRIRDGSGLSRYNRLSARALVALFEWAADAAWAPAFFDSLPGPGQGTLADRLDGVPVVAKTGTVTGARALSGVIDTDSESDTPTLSDDYGSWCYFSLLVADITVDAESVRDRQDSVVRSLTGTE